MLDLKHLNIFQTSPVHSYDPESDLMSDICYFYGKTLSLNILLLTYKDYFGKLSMSSTNQYYIGAKNFSDKPKKALSEIIDNDLFNIDIVCVCGDIPQNDINSLISIPLPILCFSNLKTKYSEVKYFTMKRERIPMSVRYAYLGSKLSSNDVDTNDYKFITDEEIGLKLSINKWISRYKLDNNLNNLLS